VNCPPRVAVTSGVPGSHRMPEVGIPAFRARVRQECCSRPMDALANKSPPLDSQPFRMICDTDCLPSVPPGRPEWADLPVVPASGCDLFRVSVTIATLTRNKS
jgi:hypothetical protein